MEKRAHSVLMGGTRLYYATDLQGTVMALSNAAGAVVSQYRYTPFGEPELVVDGTSLGNRIRYAGREWDADAGMYYNRARWYDPVLQRFASQDPIGLAGGINMYSYAGNDPVNASDPSGLRVPCYDRYTYGTITYPWLDCGAPGVDFYSSLATLQIGAGRGSNYPSWMSENAASVQWTSIFGCPPGVCSETREYFEPIQGSACRAYNRREVACRLYKPNSRQWNHIHSILTDSVDVTKGAFCSAMQTSGLEMINRQVGLFDNHAGYRTNEGFVRIYGAASARSRTPPLERVMYLKTPVYWKKVFHEAGHGAIMSTDPFEEYGENYLEVHANLARCRK